MLTYWIVTIYEASVTESYVGQQVLDNSTKCPVWCFTVYVLDVYGSYATGMSTNLKAISVNFPSC